MLFLVLPICLNVLEWFLSGIFEIFKAIFSIIAIPFKKKAKINTIKAKPVSLENIDYMDGHAFEYWCANLLRNLGYQNVDVTPGSGDQGVDIVAAKDSIRYAFQCKRYSSSVGNTPVQEVYAGMEMYGCSVGVVITNRHFTAGAIELANKVGVHLWDRGTLISLIERASKVETRPLTEDEITYYKSLPHVELEEGMEEYEDLYFADGNIIDPSILGWDEILCLVSREFENEYHAEHLAKAVEKHFCAETKIKQLLTANTYYVYVEVRVRSIMANFRDDYFVVPNWA